MHCLKIHSKVKEEEKPKFGEYESPLFYSMYEIFLLGFFFNENKLCDPGVGTVGGESRLQRVIRDRGDTSALKPVLGRGGGLGAHSPSRKDHLSLMLHGNNAQEEASSWQGAPARWVSPSLILSFFLPLTHRESVKFPS